MPTSDKSWWSLPRASSTKDAKFSSGFRSIAEAIGLKSRKHCSAAPPDLTKRLTRSVASEYISRQASSSSTLSSANLTESPKLRSRGMTDSGLPQKAGFFVKDPLLLRTLSTNSKRLPPIPATPEAVPKLRMIDRHASARVHAPPTAPPTSRLPAAPSTEPSSTSMADGCLSPGHDPRQISRPDLRSPEKSIPESVELPPPPRVLRKAPSERSLIRGVSPAASVRTTTTTTTTGLDQQPCDKRTHGIHPSRLPLPMGIRTSFSTTTQQPSVKDFSSITETKKFRKRLFSNTSQRPSTSTSVSMNRREDDSISVFSSRSDYDPSLASYKPRTVTSRSSQGPSSFWDEGPDSPATSHADCGYPQAIMSRDQLANLEASLASFAESPRTRQCSPALCPPPTQPDSITLSPTSTLQSGRRSVRARPTTAQPPSEGSLQLPVAAGPLMKEPGSSAAEQAPSADGNSTRTPLEFATGLVSLPPPPRPRLPSAISIRSTPSIATNLSCPKAKSRERPNTAITTTSPLQPGASGTGSLRAPLLYFSKSAGSQTQGNGRSPAVLEKTIHPRGLMRKSSFLEIDVENTDPEPEGTEQRDSLFLAITSSASSCNSSIVETKTGESFLDFARESIDTIRT